MGSISIRKSIRWLPDQASEPTSTIVLTSPQRRFVDLRIFKTSPDSDSTPHGQLPLESLEWGIAGTSSTTTRQDKDSGQLITRGRWEHWIDSRTRDLVADEGDMFPLSETLTLEKGSMVNPATGRETAYEEIWDDSDPAPLPGSTVTCVVLKMEGGSQEEEEEEEEKGLLVVLGRRCQVFARIGEGVTAERWDWEDGAGGGDEWRRTLWIGEGVVPGRDVLMNIDRFNVGDSCQVAGRSWQVVEVS